jgi:hypothetical protein
MRIPIYEPPQGNDGYQLQGWMTEEEYRDLGSPLILPDGRRIPRIGGGSFTTGTSTELIYQSTAVGTAKNTFTSEVLINDTAGMGAQAFLPANFWAPYPGHGVGTTIRIEAEGIVSSTATPSYTFTIRLGASANTTTASVLQSAALVTASGITNLPWRLVGVVTLTTLGAAGANSTVRGTGTLHGHAAFASPFEYFIGGGAATPWTNAQIDSSIVNYVNVNSTCTASSGSNSITIQALRIYGLN